MFFEALSFLKFNSFERALSFYKGILPPLLAETPKRAVKFFTFERYKTLFSLGGHVAQPLVCDLFYV